MSLRPWLTQLGIGLSLTALAGVAAAQTRWDLAIAWPPGNFHTRNAVAFAEAVDKATGGQVKITVHPGGALGLKGPESMRAVRDGLVPIAEYNLPQQVGDAPLFGLEGQAYLAADYAQLRTLHDIILPQYDQVFAKFGQKRLYAVPWPTQYIYTKKPIASPSDLKDLKIRTTDRTTSELVKAIGMVPVQMTFADMLPALASGGLDGVSTSAATGVDARLWEFLKFAYRTNHLWSSNAVAVNLKAWNALSAEHRAAIEKVARELEPVFWKNSEADDARSTATLVEKGLKVEAVSPSVTTALKQIAQTQTEAYAKRVGDPVPGLLSAYRAKVPQ